MAVRIESRAEPIPGYRLIERLGGGGFGEVWKAEAPGGLLKAIKFVFGDLSAASEDGQRAEQELKALSRVKTVRHPYILSLERYDIIDGQLMIVMELADRNLWDRFKECRTQGLPGIPREELLRYMEESAEALDLMNTQYQLQHLDIKPQNLFLVYQHVKVADFGLVKDLEGMQAAVTGGVTPVYAAPETFDGWVSRFSDQYSLAIVYQELLTGQRPFAGNNVRQLILQHLQSPPNVSPLPVVDQPIIARALSKKPDERYPSCREMVELLRAAGGAKAVNGQPHDPLAPDQGSPTLPPLPQQDRDDGGHSTTQSAATQSIRRVLPDSNPGTTQSIRTLEDAVLRDPAAAVRKAPAEVAGDGPLFPALVVGLGGVGLTVLQSLRENAHRRFGSLAHAPHLRFLVLDTDPEAVRAATRGNPGAAMSGADVLLTQLNRPSHYLKPRDGRPPLDKWLNPRMLYRIPRSQVTTGVRALGRLAFCDNYRTIVRRLQTELEACLDPGALTTAARQSGLGVRTNRPRVYVVANLAGGTGSGVFLDLAYTVRALLRQMGYSQPDVVGLLLLPSVDRNRTRVMALGNAFAALTELNHFAAPGACFTASYHNREAAVRDPDPPFSRCLMLQLPEETDEVATRELIDQAGQYLFRDLCSPLGKASDLARAGLTAPPWQTRGLFYQTFGLNQLSWPRHALIGTAARRLCQRLVQRWMSKDSKPVSESVQAWVQEQWAEQQLGADHLLGRLRDACRHALGQEPESAFLTVLDSLQNRPAPAGRRAAAPDLTPAEVAPVLAELEKLVGVPGGEGAGGALGSLLRDAGAKLTGEWGQKLAELPVHLIEEPAFRLAGAEEAVRQAVATIEQVLQHHEPLARDLAAKAAESYVLLSTFAAAGKAGVRRPSLSSADVLELLRSYPKVRFQSLVIQQASAAFVSLRGGLSDELREINFCRVRLTELHRQLDEQAAADPLRDASAATGERLFPFGAVDLPEAVERFLATVGPEALLELDGQIQATVRKQFTALVNVCLTSANILKNVEAAFLQTASAFLSGRLDEVNAAELFLHQHPDEEEAAGEVAGFFDEANPELSPGRLSDAAAVSILAVPPGPAGDRFRALAQNVLPDLEWTFSTSEDDVLLYREAANLSLAELELLGPAGQDAYRQMSATENFTPHTRNDVVFVPPHHS